MEAILSDDAPVTSLSQGTGDVGDDNVNALTSSGTDAASGFIAIDTDGNSNVVSTTSRGENDDSGTATLADAANDKTIDADDSGVGPVTLADAANHQGANSDIADSGGYLVPSLLTASLMGLSFDNTGGKGNGSTAAAFRVNGFGGNGTGAAGFTASAGANVGATGDNSAAVAASLLATAPAHNSTNATGSGAAGFTDSASAGANVGATGDNSAAVAASLLATASANNSTNTTGSGASSGTGGESNPTVSVNAVNPSDVIFQVAGLGSSYGGTLTFTDFERQIGRSACWRQRNYSANLSNLASGTIDYTLSVSNPAGTPLQ